MKNTPAEQIMMIRGHMALLRKRIEANRAAAEALEKEFAGLSASVGFLEREFGILPENGMITPRLDTMNLEIDTTNRETDTINRRFDMINPGVDTISLETDTTSTGVDIINSKNDMINLGFDTTKGQMGTLNSGIGVLKSGNGTLNETALARLTKAVWRSASERKIYFALPNIPGRIAKIGLAMAERGRLTVAGMVELTGASRNSVCRDIRQMKRLGWLEFHGGRRKGYFTLSGEGLKAVEA